ncbi:MAG: NAD(P)-binding protein [Planctomycetia bacterium]|nr:NAD(P)-binding protein [Planctomycetia bacterium]
MLNIAVLGASISGLTMALRLQQSGHHVSVWDERRSFSKNTAGWLFHHSSLAHLRELGVDLSDRTHRITSGEQILNHPQNGDAHFESISTHGIRQQVLHDRLLLKLGADTLHLGAQFDKFQPEQGYIVESARFRDGREVCADLFIGADGVHSKVRSVQVPGPELRQLCITEIRGTTTVAELPEELMSSFKLYEDNAMGINVYLIPTGENEISWGLQIDLRRNPLAKFYSNGELNHLLAALSNFPELVRISIPASSLANSQYRESTDQELPDRFHRGNVVLIGDAAHPLTSFLSQSIDSSLEDTQVLGDMLDELNQGYFANIDTCMTDFNRQRRPILRARQRIMRNQESALKGNLSLKKMNPVVAF